MKYDKEEIKRRAAGRGCQILQSICGLTDEQLTGLHQPCPDCGGTDRFRAFDDVNDSGGLLCNQCGKFADVFASVMWLRKCDFPEAVRLVADAIGMSSPVKPAAKKQPKEKKIHQTAEDAVGALMWAYAKEKRIDRERKPDLGWYYHNADSSEAGAVVRWNLSGGKKEFGQITKIEGGWICGGMPEPRPLLNLPAVTQAETVYVCEGEKAASALVKIDLVATTPSQGAKSPQLSDWSVLAGKRVVVLPDNDSDGDAFAAHVCRLIRKHDPDIAIEIKLLKNAWSQIPDKGDAYDWCKEFEFAEHEILRAQLQALPNRISEYNNAKEEEKPAENDSPRIDFEIIDSKTFAETEFKTEFLIDGVMTEGQSELIGGPSKVLKTSILVDKCLSLSAAVPFLGKYEVPKPKRCLLLSSESGTATLQETARRICKTKDIKLAELGDCLYWGFRPPMLTDTQHIATLANFILKNKIEVVAIDPAYLSMNLQGNEAANQFAVGAVLMHLTNLQADTGATPILATHFRMHMQPGLMPSLEHIAGAGFGQWARQWLLLNRRKPFSDENPGSHKLLMSFGGSAGHCGAVALDVEEGQIQDGRVWQVNISQLSAIREQRESERENKKRDQEQRTYESHRAAILRTLKRFPDGESMSTISTLTGISARYFRPVWEDLISCQEIEVCEFPKGKPRKNGTVKTYPGCKIVDKLSRLNHGHSDTSDTLGHCPTLSDTVRTA